MTDKKKPAGAGDADGLHDLPARTGQDDFEDRVLANVRKEARLRFDAKVGALLAKLGDPERDDERVRTHRQFLTRLLTDKVVFVVYMPPDIEHADGSLAFHFKGDVTLTRQTIDGQPTELALFAADLRQATGCELRYFIPASQEDGE